MTYLGDDIIKLIIEYASYEIENWLVLRLLSKKYYKFCKKIQDKFIDDNNIDWNWWERIRSVESLNYMINRDVNWVIQNEYIVLNVAVKCNIMDLAKSALLNGYYDEEELYSPWLIMIIKEDNADKLSWFIEFGNIDYIDLDHSVTGYRGCLEYSVFKNSIKTFDYLIKNEKYKKSMFYEDDVKSSFKLAISQENFKFFASYFSKKEQKFLLPLVYEQMINYMKPTYFNKLTLLFKQFSLSKEIINIFINMYNSNLKYLKEILLIPHKLNKDAYLFKMDLIKNNKEMNAELLELL